MSCNWHKDSVICVWCDKHTSYAFHHCCITDKQQKIFLIQVQLCVEVMMKPELAQTNMITGLLAMNYRKYIRHQWTTESTSCLTCRFIIITVCPPCKQQGFDRWGCYTAESTAVFRIWCVCIKESSEKLDKELVDKAVCLHLIKCNGANKRKKHLHLHNSSYLPVQASRCATLRLGCFLPFSTHLVMSALFFLFFFF